MDYEVTPLPSEVTPEICKDTEILEAYEVAVRFEVGAGSDEHKTFARVLGYLLRELPSQKARQAVAKQILRCREDPQELAEHGKTFVDYHIGLCEFHDFCGLFTDLFFESVRQNKQCSTPPSSSGRASTHIKESVKSQAEESPSSGNIRQDALHRDGYRCIASGNIDYESALANPSLRELEGDMESTETAHIFPQSLNRHIKKHHNQELAGQKLNYLGSVFAILDMFGHSVLSEELGGRGIHCLENVLTLCDGLHKNFDHLRLWFEPIEGQSNTYKVCTVTRRFRQTGLQEVVTLTSSDPENLPLPSTEYLAIHACCARVANLSGAAGYLDRIYRDRDEIRVLAEDGSSANLLGYLLLPLGQAALTIPQVQPRSNLINPWIEKAYIQYIIDVVSTPKQ
ncbi:hypothetical protein JVT61DRAFT_85 [Boletus reticuloceps]|uniref:HNH nuclease domain-containing protein n=1 Tax=Boletus reticuloceps TaxID=495285 RepID=A0A8I3ADM6_9AGAM|nr:hypothetical protein JVT61DRAFT_85 [Boletus reticuloceps]